MCLQEQEMLVEKVKGFPDLYDKRVKVLNKKMLYKTPGRKWQKVKILKKMIVLLEQVATENILKVAVLKKLMQLFCIRNSYRILANQFVFLTYYFGFR